MQNHGQKKYLQILLDPARAELLQQLATEKGIKPTALVRELVYQGLARSVPTTIFNEAAAKDEATWRKSVRSRVEGRQAQRERNKQGQIILSEAEERSQQEALQAVKAAAQSHEPRVTQPEKPFYETDETDQSNETHQTHELQRERSEPLLLSLAGLTLQTSQAESHETRES